ncbi:MAG: LysR family transcriptional regulator [Oligoflexia bacterium]|nr:LysR family transcriptional regulator [Oligoflexia bacterium]
MLIDNINLNHIRIFESVFRTRSMTKAAEELHMTQSGVSQHIKVLEEMLDVKLFDRIKQRPIPTAVANTLYEKCYESLNNIEQALFAIKGGDKVLSGNISLAIPIEFGNNMVLPLLVEFGKKHPGITYTIQYGLASQMNDLLLRGELDFAIVDDLAMDRILKSVRVFDEELCLCSSKVYMQTIDKGKIQTESKKFFETLDYIDYAEGGPLLNAWFRHHYKSINIKCNVRSAMMDVQGVAKMITEGFGVGVLPFHYIAKLEKEGCKFHIFKGNGKVLKNTISLVYIQEKTRSEKVKILIDFLVSSFSAGIVGK